MSTRYGSIAPSRRPLTIRTWPRRQANSVNRWAPTVLQAALPVPLCARWCHLIIAKPYDICSKPALDIMLAELQSWGNAERSTAPEGINNVVKRAYFITTCCSFAQQYMRRTVCERSAPCPRGRGCSNPDAPSIAGALVYNLQSGLLRLSRCTMQC